MSEVSDFQISLWISQLLAGELDDSQQAKLHAALQQSPASQAFAGWSSRIQDAAAETHRLESLPPEDGSIDRAECLSDLSKARLQHAVLSALKQGTELDDFQQQLRVAQSPSVYNQRLAEREADIDTTRYEELADTSQRYDELLRGGRELRGRLIGHFSGMLQTLHWLAATVSLSHLQDISGAHDRTAPPPAATSDGSSIGLEQLSSVVASMLRVQTSLCAVSLARYQTHDFEELLRVQRGPRDFTDVRVLPVDRLRRAAASAFHQNVFDAPPQTPIVDLDRSVAGWHRIVLGLPLTTRVLPVQDSENPSTAANVATDAELNSHRWGLAVVEADIDRLVNMQVVAARVDATVTLIDQHDRVWFSNASPSDAHPVPVAEFIRSQVSPAQKMVRTGELQLPHEGVWASLLDCPAPLDNLRLVLWRTG